MTVKFIIRRDDPTLFWGRFTATDIVIGFVSIFPPWIIYLVTRLPLPVDIAMSVLPAFFYVLKFRMGKPPGYFRHWLRFKLRPKIWRYGVQHCDTLMGVRSRWLLCARPLEEQDGRLAIWPGVGFPRRAAASAAKDEVEEQSGA